MMIDKNTAVEYAHTGMGTEMIHKVFGRHAEKAVAAVECEAQRLENLLSRYVAGSEIGRINRSAGGKCEKLSLETYELLSQAAEFSKLSDGLFNVTIGPLVDLWNYKHSTEIPDEAKIKQAVSLINYSDLILDDREKTAGLRKKGQSIDLGGIAKGYASGRFLEIVQQYGITSAFTNIGGNVAVLGGKPDGSPWNVGIRHPREQGRLLGSVSVMGKAVVTSGDYERYFIDESGIRRHHILNPVTGYPSESGLVSVTVVTNSAMTADALSTVLFLSGMEKAVELLKNFPQTEAVFINDQMNVTITRGLKKTFRADAGTIVNIL